VLGNLQLTYLPSFRLLSSVDLSDIHDSILRLTEITCSSSDTKDVMLNFYDDDDDDDDDDYYYYYY
jgi:hypothetical protein